MPKKQNTNGRGASGGARQPRNAVARFFDWNTFKPSMIETNDRPSFVEELTTYRDHLPELLERAGAYVVIKGQNFKILADREAALLYVEQNYKVDETVLVKKIVEKEPVLGLGGAVL